MSRFIINIEDGIEDIDAIRYLKKVVAEGKVSNYGENYCYVTQFYDGPTVHIEKTRKGTHTVRVYYD